MSEFLSDQDFEKYKNFIYDKSGIFFSSSNRTILESRLRERLRTTGHASVGEYFNLITKDQEEMRVLLDSVTTNLTRFFRNTAHYDTFINFVIPDLVKRKKTSGDKTFKLWSAGCSSGEEPYTNAMVLSEYLPPDFTIDILASDLSLKSLMKAKEGFYPTAKINGIPDNYMKKYMDPVENGYVMKDSIKKLIRFDYHNLKFPADTRNLDVIFCRNVLIYFDEAAQKNVVEGFWNSMKDHSYLFIGHSESLFGMNTKFEFIKTDWACIYGKNITK